MSTSDDDGRTEIGDDELCPCESGRTYEECCKSGLGRLFRLPNGEVIDERPIPEQAAWVIDETETHFADVFGRKPQRGDKIFLVAHLDADAEMMQMMQRLHANGTIRPEFIFAYKTTGLLPTEVTYPLMSERDREDWDGAIDEFGFLIEEGIDPFTGLNAEVRDLLDCLPGLCQDCAIHFGSYVDRYRKNRKLDMSEFLQVLILSRTQKILLLLKDKIGPFPKADALILIRSLFECYLVFEFLGSGPEAGLYFVARASPKTGAHFRYKERQNGRVDKSVVIDVKSGAELPGYVSFYEMAKGTSHPSDVLIFDRIYDRLSDEVHFSFKNWRNYWMGRDVIRTSTEAVPAEVASLFLLTVLMLTSSVAQSKSQTKPVRRDAGFLFRRVRKAFGFLLSNLDEPPSDVFFDEQLMRAIGLRLSSSKF